MLYLDYAATTPLDPHILEAMTPYFSMRYGNASSVHQLGRESRMAIERARNSIAHALGAEQGEILFTGSASEANNLVVKGLVEKVSKGQSTIPEILVSAIEHPCIMESVRHVERLGWAKVVWLPVSQSGHVQLADIESAMTERTVLITVMYVNNEIGTVQPICDIGDLVRREKNRRKGIENALPIFFHTDAVQAIQYFDCAPALLGVDLMTLAPHKAYGPKGVGVLYKNEKVHLTRQTDGGGQEYYLRAGTENVANVVGAGMAIDQAIKSSKVGTEGARLQEMKKLLVESVKEKISDMVVIGENARMAPHIVNLVINNCDSEALIAALDREGFAVSSGSACSSGVVKKSQVIEALHLGMDTYAPLRVSFGRETTWEQVAQLVNALPRIVTRIRELEI